MFEHKDGILFRLFILHSQKGQEMLGVFFHIGHQYCVETSACRIQVTLLWNYIISIQGKYKTNACIFMTFLERSTYIFTLNPFVLLLLQSYAGSWQLANANFLQEKLVWFLISYGIFYDTFGLFLHCSRNQ